MQIGIQLGAIFASLVVTAFVAPTSSHSIPINDSTALSVRNAHAMIYDTDSHAVVLFGGADASRVRGDTWEWDSQKQTWKFMTAVGPSPRTFPAFAYDERHHEGILFGGNQVLFGNGQETNSFLADTWRFRNHQWEKIKIPGPGERAEASVSYDTKRGRIVLFGGYRRLNGVTERLGDTWEWDGNAWRRMASRGPAPRNSGAMAYDEKLHKTILFGGPGPSNETWAWDGHQWKQLTVGEVPGRFDPVMAYDVVRQKILRFGGWNGRVRVADTWAFNSEGWRQLSVPGPSPRNHSAMVYDRDRGRLVLFGGHDGENVFGDTWEWNGSAWILVESVPFQRFVDNGH